MPTSRAGFTLIELMIVVAIIAIIASIAIPNLASARVNANETAAIATLRSLSASQAQIRASGIIDTNFNGAGEFGFFGELAAVQPVRNDESGGVGTDRLRPPVLSTAFGRVVASRVLRSGYTFQMFLPDTAGAALAEAANGGAAGVSVSGANSEIMWCAYAWPSSYGNTGRRAFFVNQVGDVLSSQNSIQRYSGSLKPITPDAAFLQGTANVLSATVATNGTGKDGQRWVVVN